MTVKCIGDALKTAGHPFEFLCCDNGSGDRRVIDYIAGLEPAYFRQNVSNEGCAQMHNQMLLRAKGDLFALLDNDIEIRRDNWLRDLVDAYNKIPNSGMIGIHTDNLCPEMHAPETIEGIVVHPARPPKEDAVFGTRLFGRAVLAKVGAFCEDYFTYSLCDNEYNTRVHHSGFMNYYISGPSGVHLGQDVGEQSSYRRMKDDCLRRAAPIMHQNLHKYFSTGNFYLSLPELR